VGKPSVRAIELLNSLVLRPPEGYKSGMKTAIVLGLVLFANGFARAQAPFELTKQLHKMSADELSALKSRAEGGDARSQYLLGVTYTIGFRRLGIKADSKEAAKWLAKPSLKDNPDARFWLLYPSNTKQNLTSLRAALKELAEQGSLGAMNFYADFAVEGAGGPKDYAEAMKWWSKSAEMDSAEGQFNLALMYLDGEGVPVDAKEAVKWLRLAADKGFPDAAARIAPMAMMKQYGLEPNTDVRKWLITAAEAGDALSMMNLGMSYFHEIGGSADYVEAYKWYTLAVKFGAKQNVNVIDGRPGLKPKMTPEQVVEAETNAKDWEQGFAPHFRTTTVY
jgi:uncharacterized protein